MCRRRSYRAPYPMRRSARGCRPERLLVYHTPNTHSHSPLVTSGQSASRQKGFVEGVGDTILLCSQSCTRRFSSFGITHIRMLGNTCHRTIIHRTLPGFGEHVERDEVSECHGTHNTRYGGTPHRPLIVLRMRLNPSPIAPGEHG